MKFLPDAFAGPVVPTYRRILIGALVSALRALKDPRPAFASIPGLALALLVSLAGLPLGAAVFDDFESYAVGSNLHGQGGWSGWAGNPGAGAVVSTTFSFSPTRAVNVTGATDLVRTFSGVTNGQWVFKVMQYIPATSSGTNYAILLNRYRPPFGATDLNWSVQIQNNLNTGQIISDLGAGASRPMVKNQWVEIRIEINLASNTVAEFYNGQPLSTHVWQDGSGLNELQAFDLFADNSGPVYYDNVSLAPAPPADGPGTALRISNTGPNLEGLPTFMLEWDAISNATYLVQSAESLAPGSQWTTLDAVFVPDKAGSYQIQVVATDSTGLLSPTKFFRLVLPQPKIFSVEPAVIAPGTPVDFYVVGQCFPTNAELRIKGLPQSGTIYQSSTTLVQPSFVPDVPGDYQFDLVVGGVVVSSFNVVCADVAVSPELVLQGPPTMEPPASPQLAVLITAWLSRKGYEYYQAKSAMSAAGLHNNPYFVDNSMTGDMPSHDSHISKRGYDYYKAQSDVTYDVQEGKKGLNAVNVKLARMAGGGGEELPKESLEFNYGSARGGKITKSRSNIQNNRMTGGVQPFSGEVQLAEMDFAIPGRGLDFVWARTYRARPGNQGVINFTVTRWTHSYDVAVAQTAAGIAVADGTGRLDTFKLQTNGTYTCPQFFREGTISNNTFTLTFADTGRWIFNPFDSSLAAGKLRQIITRNGDTMTLGYDTSGRLAQIVDDLDRTNTIAYNSSGQLASVTDFSGRTVGYEYDGNGDLVSVISPPVTGTPNGNDFPGGKTNRYTYSSGYLDDRENHLLLSVIDATGQAIYKHVYQHNQTDLEFLRCISVQHWTNTPTVISYLPQTPVPSNQFAALRCIVNDPVGDVTEYFFDARGRCVKEQEFTGRATPGVPVTAAGNRPVNKLRSSDPDFYETQWTWNNDSLRISTKEPAKLEYPNLRCVYQSDFDATTPARKRADLRVVREFASSPVDVDGDGTVDLTQRASYFTYDPRFGSDLGARRRLRSGIIAEVGAGRPATVGRESAAKSSKDDQLKFRARFPLVNNSLFFVTSSTDPRGNVATGTFDAKGNRVKVKFYWDRQSSADLDFSYNVAGQLTAVTNAPDANGHRRVDTFNYYSSGAQAGYLQSCVADVGGLALTESYEYDARGSLTRCIDPRGNDTLYTCNSLDQLVQTESASLGSGGPGGYRIKTQFFYDANDNLTLVAEENRDANGTPGTNPFWRTQFVYDGGQRLTGCWRDKNGALVLRCTEVAYNAANQVVLYRSPEAVNGNDPFNTVAFAYDECGLDYRTIVAPGSPVQSTTQYDYDANGLVTRVSEGLEGTPSITMMEYDGFAGFGSFSRASGVRPLTTLTIGVGTVSHASGVPHRAVFSHLDVRDSFAAPTISGPATKKKVYNVLVECLRVSRITDPNGNVTTFHYDANDNLKAVRDFGQLNDVPGTNGNIRLAESRYEYDGLDHPIRSRDSFFSLPSQAPIGDGERTTTFAYAPNGQCFAITNDLGNSTTYDYDTAGRVYLVKTPRTVVQASTVHVQRDAVGNIIQVTQTDQPDLGGPPQVFSWTSIFDEMNRCVSTADNVGNTNLFAYDSRGNCVRATDPKGNETVYAYDGLSRGLSFTASQGAAASGIVVSSGQFDYDDNDRCISSTDANGNVTLHACDSLDRCTQTTQADGTHNSLVWSPRSNLIQETDANGTVITHTYDANDRCVSNHITPGAGVAATTTFETFAYDGCSRLVAATNDVSHSEFDYDSHGNIQGNHTDGWNVLSAYDSVGRRTSLTYPGGRVLTYAYDALDQCTNILESGASLASFSYAGPGRMARVIYGNGARADLTYDGIVGTPNAPGDFGQGKISSVTHAAAARSPRYVSVNLSCDPNGNKTRRTDTIFAPAIPRTNDLGLEYDAANRLTRATLLSGPALLRDTVYGLDRMGNRTNVTGAASCSGSYFMDGLFPGPLDFQMNQYTATPCDTRTYDDNGNLVSRSSAAGPTTYQCDYAGRLVQMQAMDFSSASVVITSSTYAYDALGRRVSKTVSSGGLPPTTTEYVYDVKFEYAVTPYKDGEANEMRSRPGRLLEERENGLLTASFVLDATRSQDDGVIQMRRGGQDYYFHTDDQGNVLALTTTGGAVAEYYDYDDYGKVTFLTSDGIPTSATSSAVGNPYCWRGRLDDETGLYNDDGGGYFDPQTGRFTRRGYTVNTRSDTYFTVRGYTSTARSDTPLGCDAPVNPWSGGGGSGFNLKASKNMTLKGQKIMQNFSLPGGGPVWPNAGYNIIIGNTVGASTAVLSSR